MFGNAPIPSGSGGNPNDIITPAIRAWDWFRNLPWANQRQWAGDDGDYYSNPPGQQVGGGIEGGVSGDGSSGTVRRALPYRAPAGNLGANAAAGARSPVRGATRWDFTQGRMVPVDNASGAQFNSQAANALLMAFQGMHGNPNSPGVSDSGPTRFYNGVMQMDEGGNPTQVNDRIGGYARPTRTLFNSPGSISAYNSALASPSYAANPATQPFGWLGPLPPSSGSGGNIPPEYTTPIYGIGL
jgi:hypothetical protein